MESPDDLQTVAEIVQGLDQLGLRPVLVGGMALVILGSRRVTHDYDFIVTNPGRLLAQTIELFYDSGLELVSRLNDEGQVVSTIDNRKIAAIRLRLDAPASAYFCSVDTRLRVDLFFDFPFAAVALAEHANQMKIRGQTFSIAADEDLLKLKEIARAGRSKPGDAEDIAFLEARLKRRT
jgi:hypothetical protein